MAANSPRPNDGSRLTASSASSQDHRPTNPSGLRTAHMPPPSPDDRRNNGDYELGQDEQQAPGRPTNNGIQPIIDGASIQAEPSSMTTEGAIDEPEANARTRLLGEAQKYNIPTHENCGEENCNHGNMSPRPRHHRGYGSFAPSVMSTDGFGGSYNEERVGSSADSIHGILGDALADSLMPRDGTKLSATQYIAQRNKVKHSRMMYVVFPSRLQSFLLNIFKTHVGPQTNAEAGI
jgi:hypothetical protein